MSSPARTRHTAPSPEEVVRRYLDRADGRLAPDPLFRRRLRGAVLNRFVAQRHDGPLAAAARSVMTTFGRAALYASFAVAASVGGVMAASRSALPGDVLYPVKLRIEALRMEMLPAEFHDDLAVYVVSQRIHELTVLTEAGEWGRAAGLAESIEEGYARLAVLGVGDVEPDPALGARLEVLQSLVEGLPDRAQEAVQHAMEHGRGGQNPPHADDHPALSGPVPVIDSHVADDNDAHGQPAFESESPRPSHTPNPHRIPRTDRESGAPSEEPVSD